jgi:hypothetical protein
MWSSGRSEPLMFDAGLPVPIEIRQMRSARRLRLRFDHNSGTLKLTCPSRTSQRAALAWALDQREWVEAQLARALPPEPFEPGAMIPIEGLETQIAWREQGSRSPKLVDGELHCGGPREGLARRINLFLRNFALKTMSDEAAEFAAVAGLRLVSVSVGDASSRWGSCSSNGRIRLSWRLILAPTSVRRYVVAHEVAHLRHLNHGPEFKALELQLFGSGLAEAKIALRRIGPRLRRVGRGR